METALLDYINNSSNVSFVDIEELFEKKHFDYKGEYAIELSKHPNIILWCGWNMKAIDLFHELMSKELIEMNSCDVMVYMVDGKALKYSIANKLYPYKTIHWLPVVIKKHKCLGSLGSIN